MSAWKHWKPGRRCIWNNGEMLRRNSSDGMYRYEREEKGGRNSWKAKRKNRGEDEGGERRRRRASENWRLAKMKKENGKCGSKSGAKKEMENSLFILVKLLYLRKYWRISYETTAETLRRARWYESIITVNIKSRNKQSRGINFVASDFRNSLENIRIEKIW